MKRILIKGAGDLATGTAVRLYRAGFHLVMTDIEQPTAVRRTVAFCQCMYDGVQTVEGITARRVYSGVEALAAIEKLRETETAAQSSQKPTGAPASAGAPVSYLGISFRQRGVRTPPGHPGRGGGGAATVPSRPEGRWWA